MANTPQPPTPTTDIPALPRRAETTHKVQVGRVALIAGSRGMSGAACLAAVGALRGGTGLVRVLTPACVQPIVAASEPCLMTVALPETEAGQIARAAWPVIRDGWLGWTDVVALGPGLGQSNDMAAVIGNVLEGFAGPLVIDADGLNNLANVGPKVWSPRHKPPTVLTPHPGELNRLLHGAGMEKLAGDNDQARLAAAHAYARVSQCTVVLKGHRTVVCTADQAYVNTTGNPGMATGGMGDVLTGLLAALLGQGLGAFDAARLAVYCHGLAADRCAKQIGPVGYLARDVAEMLPAALAQASKSKIGFK
ncbi:MAG: NAD(P)H-hydrate dehydratase [Phycisphaerae bacterium]